MTEPPRFSVVIPTRDRGPLLADCVRSLLAQAGAVPYEVVVADDGSTDETAVLVHALAEASEVPVRSVRLDGRGPNAARNAGIAAARGAWLCFVDDDQLAPPDHLRRVMARLDADPTIDGLGGPVREAGGPPFRTCERCSLGTIELPEADRDRPWWLLAGNMTLRRELFDAVGPFDEELRGIGEESEWFHRLDAPHLVYDPDLWLWHRKDHVTLPGAVRGHYRAGRNIPRSRQLTGRPSEPTVRSVARSLGHLARRRCWKGLLTAAREVGHLVGARQLRRTSARTR